MAKLHRQKKQVFISYSRSDRLAVDQLVADLRRRHYQVWMDVDEQGIEPGEDWRAELVKQMAEAEGVIACVSPDFLRSQYCQEELEQAQREGKPLYPVLVRRFDKGQSLADVSLDHLQYVDLTANYREGLRRLAAVMPRPRFPTRYVAQRILAAVVVLLGLVIFGVIAALASDLNTTLREPTATPPPPTPIPSLAGFDVGIAVAYFALPADSSVSPDEANALAEQVAGRVRAELISFGEQAHMSVGFLAPQDVGRVEGTTRAQREASASALASRYSADLVLYGQIEQGTGGTLEMQPEFYVVPEAFGDALEITGSYRLGKGIQVEGPLSAIRNAMNVNRPLSARTLAAAQIFAGLTYYALEDYDHALTTFKAALDLPDWQDAEGREVIYVLIGNVQTRLASVATQRGDPDEARDQITAAMDSYYRAETLAPDYERPYAGQASADYIRWTLSALNGTPDLELLNDALDNLQKADDAGDETEDIGVQSRQLLTRVQVDFNRWAYHAEAYSDDDLNAIYDGFEDAAGQIIRRYDDGRNSSLQPLVSEAYALLGLAAYVNADCETALEHYQQALDLSQSSRRRMFFEGYMGECYLEQGQHDAAVEAFNAAVDLGQRLDVPASVLAPYTERLDELSAKS